MVAGPARIRPLLPPRPPGVEWRLIIGLARSRGQDLAIQELHAPESVSPGEAYMITAWVRLPSEQSVDFKLVNGRRVVASGKRELSAGLNRLLFRDRAMIPGTAQYDFTVARKTMIQCPKTTSRERWSAFGEQSPF